MMDEERPDPDQILRAIQQEEKKAGLGRLKLFFGMSAGVGKTYAMLEEAHQKLLEGVRVLAATINTHGRIETENILKGLPAIDEKWVAYKGRAFKELDLEKILEIRPQLVLIDELAHANVPGSKHAKRWQDVVEILDAGIDVYTTLNVQHLESRKDLVESITGIAVHETVPDLILERATSIEMVDITPADLLQRLKEGKVYLGDQSLTAAQNFFQEDHLTALREIALRFTAEKVDHDLHGILAMGKGWKTRERLMVAVSPAHSSQQLIRSARRLAFELDAPWVAVYVDMGIKLEPGDQVRLNKNLQLAKELGAETVTVRDVDIANALQRIARQKNITRLVIGRPTEPPLYKQLFQKSMIDRLAFENKQMDILILREDKLVSLYKLAIPTIQLTSPAKSYAAAFGVIALITLIGYFLTPFIGYKPISFIYLAGILILGLGVGQGPVLFAAALSAVCWDFFFIPPLFDPQMSEPEDIALVVVYFLAALFAGVLTSRYRKRDQFLFRREEEVEHLSEIMREIAKSTNFQYLRLNVGSKLKALFEGDFELLAKGGDNQLVFDGQIPILNRETERAAALWCFQNGKLAGWSSDTLPSAEALYIPIKFAKDSMGVLVYYPKNQKPLTGDELNFLQTVADQLGLYLERYVFKERVQSQNYALQVEKLHHAIFHSLSKGFYAPFEKMAAINEKIKKLAKSPEEQQLFNEMVQAEKNLKMIVDNILTISQLESGFVSFDKQKNSLKELIAQSIAEAKTQINGHPISIEGLEEGNYFFDFDFNLMKTALKNLLINAIEYSPTASVIKVAVDVMQNEYKISVVDEGAGIPQEMIPTIFEKFTSLSGGKIEGIGLGLAIVKDVIEIHKGRMDVQSEEGKGTTFSLILPVS